MVSECTKEERHAFWMLQTLRLYFARSHSVRVLIQAEGATDGAVIVLELDRSAALKSRSI